MSATLRRAEKAVIAAALASVDANGWIFQERGMGGAGNAIYVLKPDAVRKLESAVSKLKTARRKARRVRADRADATKEK